MAKARTNRAAPSTITMLTLAASAVTAVWAAAMMTPGGRVAYVYVFAYAEFYAGVIALVGLSLTVMTGLIATDRLVLSIRQRVLAQSAHRTAGVIAVAALALHVGTKLAEGHVRAIDAVVPFLAPGRSGVFLGFGIISGFLMVVMVWTGVARARFASRGRPWMWRSIHVIAYPMWPLALVHGLSAGRPAAGWVVVCYLLCVLGVLVGLAVRISARGRQVFPEAAVSSAAAFSSATASTRTVHSTAASPPAFEAPAPAPAYSAPVPSTAFSAPPAFEAPAPASAFSAPVPSSAFPAPMVAVARAAVLYHPAPAPATRPPRVVARHAVEPGYLPPDETPTLVDLAARRARKEERRRDGTVQRARRPRRPADDATADIEYWRRMRRDAR